MKESAPARMKDVEQSSPAVHLGADFLRRVERLAATLSAARERREGVGRGALSGGGEEFVGYRPYRPGEDLRRLDWNLYARLDRPFVRVTRREAGERWAVLLDASASMGVGPPLKLQRAAETAAALACIGLRFGADVVLHMSDVEGVAALELRRRGGTEPLLRFLEGRRAAGKGGAQELLRRAPRFVGAARVFLVGDLLDVDPSDLFKIGRRGRELFAAQVLAPHELEPAAVGAVDWFDPEAGAHLELDLDAATIRAYESRLAERLDAWRTSAAHHRASYGCWSTRTPFEDVVRGLLRQ